MDILTQFEELKKQKKSEIVVSGLKRLLTLSKEGEDRSLTMDILLYLSETLRIMRAHDESIELLEQAISDEYFTEKDHQLAIIDELVRTLLRVENFIKLKSILYTRERLLTNDHQKIMQKFYYAVCLEGLKENKTAIDYLLSIKDNISNSNLVSKYLKLSMLHLKEHLIEKAKEYYQIAVKFDHKRKNPIFDLAESDILYYEGDYINSLVMYQEYFIKSKNKNRYLDRYILINIKLNRLDEAWRFYQEYLPTMNNLISINYRVVFYEAAQILAKELGNTLEYEKLQDLIQDLEPKSPVLNQFDHVYRLLSLSFVDKKYTKERDILLDLFKALDSLYPFQKLLYIQKSDDYLRFYHFSKGLLLEKNPKVTDYSGTIIETILATDPVNDLYTYDDIIPYSKSMYKTVETSYIFVNGLKKEDRFDYFVVFTKEKENFDFQQKLVLLAYQILKKELIDFDNHQKQYQIYSNYQTLFTQEKIGVIKIEKGIIHLLNDYAKSILCIDNDYISFEEFQGHLVHKVFIDEFLYTETLRVSLKTETGSKDIEFSITKDEFTIYATVKDAINVSKKGLINSFANLPSEVQMLEDLKSISNSTIFLFHITNYLSYFKDYNYSRYQLLLNEFVEELKLLAKNHFNKFYLESFHLGYLVINSIDKRVITRIMEQSIKRFDKFALQISVTQVANGMNYDHLIKLRYLNSLTTKEKPTRFDNKNFRYNLELAKTILINVNTLILAKYVPLEYQVVADWSTNQIEYLYVDISSKAMLGEKSSLTRVLKANDLETEWNLVIIQSLAKNLKNINYVGKLLVDISYKTLMDIKVVKRIVKRLQSIPLALTQIVFSIDVRDITAIEDIKESLMYLQEQQIGLCGIHFLGSLQLEQLHLFEYFTLLVLEKSDIQRTNLMKFLKILDDFEITYILNHKKESILKSNLTDFHIRYIYGDKYPKYENITQAME